MFTSIFLSRDFFQYFFIVVFQLILLSSFEYASGPLVALSMYVFSGAIGALFGSTINCCNDTIYIHAQSAISGLVGALFAVNTLIFVSALYLIGRLLNQCKRLEHFFVALCGWLQHFYLW